MVTGTKRQMQNAVNAARAMGGPRNVRWLGGYAYEVTGSKGDTYRVYWQQDNARCSCPAGKHGRVCKHLARCWLWKVGRQMGAAA